MLERERMASVIPHKPQVIPQNNFAFVHEGPLTQESINYSMDIEESCIDKLGFQVQRMSVTEKLKQYGQSPPIHHKSENHLSDPARLASSLIPSKQQSTTQVDNFKRQSVKLEQNTNLVSPKQIQETPLPGTPGEGGFDLNGDDSFAYGLSHIMNRESMIGGRPASQNVHSILEGSILLRTVELNTAQTPEERGDVLIKMTQRQNQLAAMGILQRQVVELPDSHILITKEPLLVRSPIVFRGSPGTILEIESSIVIDIDTAYFSEQNERLGDVTTMTEFAQRPLVQFSECVIRFSRSPAEGEPKEAMPLFLVTKGSRLVMRDCQLKTQVFQNYINSSRLDYGEVQDVCFQLSNIKRPNMSTAVSSQISRLQQDKGDTALQVVSCTMDGFAHFVEGGEDASIQIELSSLSNARGTAIEVTNPLRLCVQRSIIEKALGNAVVVRYQSQEGVAQNKVERELIFDAAIIMGNVGSGIVVMGEKEVPEEAKGLEHKIGANIAKTSTRHKRYAGVPKVKLLEIKKTRIYHCKKDGLMVKNIVLHQNNGVMRLDSNQFQNNKDNNIWLYGIQRPLQSRPLHQFQDEVHSRICGFVLHSRIYDAESGYGVYAYDTNIEIEDSQILGNTSGGVMLVGKKESSREDSPCCRIMQSTIKSNKESGIIISDLQGRVDIARCEVSDNNKCGITATQRLESPASGEMGSTQALLMSSQQRGAHETPFTSESLMEQKTSGGTKLSPKETLRLVQKTGARVRIEICDISYNGDHGILLRNVEVSVKESRIQNNSNNAIAMDEPSKLCLKILEYQSSTRRLIMGLIGGSWGSVSPSNCTGEDKEAYFYAGMEGSSSVATLGLQDQQRQAKRKENEIKSSSKKCRCFPSQSTQVHNRGGLVSATELHTAVSQTQVKNSEFI